MRYVLGVLGGLAAIAVLAALFWLIVTYPDVTAGLTIGVVLLGFTGIVFWTGYQIADIIYLWWRDR